MPLPSHLGQGFSPTHAQCLTEAYVDHCPQLSHRGLLSRGGALLYCTHWGDTTKQYNGSYESHEVWHCCNYSYTLNLNCHLVCRSGVGSCGGCTDETEEDQRNEIYFIEIYSWNFPIIFKVEEKLLSHFLRSSFNLSSLGYTMFMEQECSEHWKYSGA